MVVQRNEQFNGKDVSHYIRDYKMVMLQYGISERLQVISFNRVATDEFKERIHGRQQQNSMWGSFEEALQEAYDCKRLKGRGRGKSELWVSLVKTHQSAKQAFLEFEHHFAQLSEREQRLVGMDQFLMFVRSID